MKLELGDNNHKIMMVKIVMLINMTNILNMLIECYLR